MAVLTLPPAWGWPQGVHVHVGGCVQGHNRYPATLAHAHEDSLYGWICVIDPSLPLYDHLGGPSWVLLHELAHVLAGHHGHTRTWARIYAGLGGIELPPGLLEKGDPPPTDGRYRSSRTRRRLRNGPIG